LDLPDSANLESFSWLDLMGLERWNTFVPVFTSLTVIGATTYLGRFRYVGAKVEFQISLLAATSIASVAGTTYLSLPTLRVRGIAGHAAMTNATTKVAVGLGHIDIANARCYLPAQVASGNTFNLFGEYEV